MRAFERCDVPARLLPSQQGAGELARRAARQARLAAPPAAPATVARWRSHLLSRNRAAHTAPLHFSSRLLPATLTQQSSASRATRDGRDRQHWRLVIAGGGTVSQSGAAQAASLHFSARLLPARATQLSAARRAMRRSQSAAPPTVRASGAGRPRHWLRRMSGAAQAASLHFVHSAAAGVGDGVTPWAVS